MTFKEMAQDEQIRTDIREIKASLSNIEVTLRGDAKSDEPGGVVYNVSQNTRFRKNIQKVLWILFSTNAGIIMYFIVRLIGGD